MNPFLNIRSYSFCIILGLSIFATTCQYTYGQLHNFVVKDTTASAIVVNPDHPGMATIIIYSPLPHLTIDSPIELVATAHEELREEYLLTIQPDTPHMLSFQYPGFRTQDLRIPPIAPNQTRSYVVAPPPGFRGQILSIETSPDNAEITVDGVSIGMSNLKVYLSPGTHSVHISKEGYNTIAYSAQISEGEDNLQRFTLSRADLPVTITSNVEGARVFINDEEIGATPLSDWPLPQGVAELRVENPGYKPYVDVIDIRNEGANRIHIELETRIELLPSQSVYVQNETAHIEGETLIISYDLASERSRYKVDISLFGPDDVSLPMKGLTGAMGKKVTPGTGHVIYWPIDQSLPQENLKVQIHAKPGIHPGWFIGGGLGIGGGIATAILVSMNPDDDLVGRPPGRPQP